MHQHLSALVLHNSQHLIICQTPRSHCQHVSMSHISIYIARSPDGVQWFSCSTSRLAARHLLHTRVLCRTRRNIHLFTRSLLERFSAGVRTASLCTHTSYLVSRESVVVEGFGRPKWVFSVLYYTVFAFLSHYHDTQGCCEGVSMVFLPHATGSITYSAAYRFQKQPCTKATAWALSQDLGFLEPREIPRLRFESSIVRYILEYAHYLLETAIYTYYVCTYYQLNV